MPELPEVECVRLSLERLLVGRTMMSVRVNREEVIGGVRDPEALLVGQKVSAVRRHGKQLALLGESGGVVLVHLGMSGQLCVMTGGHGGRALSERSAGRTSSSVPPDYPAHTHVLWGLDEGLWLRFTDPRRFGGLWTYADEQRLWVERWSSLGPDALVATPRQLSDAFEGSSRSIKAALLDQQLIAGLGNIYVDELLFNARLHPLMRAGDLPAPAMPGLVRRMRRLLTGAIARGGSSLRDYVDGNNQRGSQQTRHRVYGRSGQRCKRRGCKATILCDQVAGRTTAWCPACQHQ